VLYVRSFICKIPLQQLFQFHLQTWMPNGIWCVHPPCKEWNETFHLVSWRQNVWCSTIFGTPVLPVRARCSMHTISLQPCTFILAAMYLDRLPKLVSGTSICATACWDKFLCPEDNRASVCKHAYVRACMRLCLCAGVTCMCCVVVGTCMYRDRHIAL